MKYVKRIIAATAAATMLLSGCGTQPVKDTGDEQVTLKWMFLGPGEQQEMCIRDSMYRFDLRQVLKYIHL